MMVPPHAIIMTTYTIHTAREDYRVTAQGYMTRECTAWSPSGQWRIVSLVRHRGFGVPSPNRMQAF
jgi:hypothetical protein